MSRIALAVAAALLSVCGFAAGQTMPPTDIHAAPGSAAAEPPAFKPPMPTPFTSPNFLPPVPSPSTVSPADASPQLVPNSSNQTPKSNPNDSMTSGSTESLPPAIQPVTKPPPLADTIAPSAGRFPTVSSSPANYRFWAGAEYLLWWEKKEQLPANLVTTGLPTDAVPGALGQPNTLGLSGPGTVNFGLFSGIRLFGGTWLDPQQIIGVDASGFVLQEHGQGFDFTSTVGGNPLLALRHLDAFTRAQDAFVIAKPSASNGGIAVHTESQLWGADVNVAHLFCCLPSFRLVGLFGFRYLDLSEGLSLQTRTMAIDSSTISFQGQHFATPAYDLTADRFHARSQFFGGQAGLRGEYYFSHFFVAATGKLALGRTNEVMDALGVSTLQIGTFPLRTAVGGLFAQLSNSGHFVNQDFGVVPELHLKGGVLLTRWLRATIGYDVLYWSRVLRAGDTLDLTIDNRQVPTSTSFQAGVVGHSPQPAFNTSSFWVQGLTLGLEFTY